MAERLSRRELCRNLDKGGHEELVGQASGSGHVMWTVGSRFRKAVGSRIQLNAGD